MLAHATGNYFESLRNPCQHLQQTFEKKKKKKLNFEEKKMNLGQGAKRILRSVCVRVCQERTTHTPPHLRDCLRFEK